MTARAVLSMYDDTPCDVLRTRSGAACIIAVEYCASTMDLAHQRATDGAPNGTVVVADEQGAGRGRTGKAWRSARGAGVWASVLLRRQVEAPSGVLSLRVGLHLSERLDALAAERIQLKWPNDLLVGGRKLAGVLTEARWRGDALEWIVIGVGVNVRDAGGGTTSVALGAQVRRADVLVHVIDAVLAASEHGGELSPSELAQYASRDIARGRDAVEPLRGTVVGITARGGLQVRTDTGDAVAVAGSLVFRTPLPE